MKRTLLLLSFCLIFVSVSAQVAFNQVDDFEVGTTANWVDPSGTGTENVANDGPNGAGDNYLRDYTNGNGAGSGSKLIIRNSGNQWSGDFLTEGVQSITLNVRALINTINLRLSINGSGGKFSTTNVVTVAPSDGWILAEFSITPSDWTAVSDGIDGGAAGTDINATLANVTQFRILSNPNPSWVGEAIDAEMHLDNITASGSLSIKDFENQDVEFSISPNPAKSRLNIIMPTGSDEMNLEVFDVLGKRVHKGTITQLSSSVNVSSWKSGVYLVKLSDGKTTQTKRFIKQ
ncbi:T9SS type A sorting domain-containing protein [Winogradskyella sp. MH6]|uniref:T9SS type A sorting domain-containing protein n=1 Tax=Winogradskyella sp. MH6 TaxID=2929510 RepID=UPI001FB4F339|nr:T9SS type A sorting domain-containing protein [Winogradskyella sp. MH6]